jgi:hypothetical protein
MRIAQLYKLGTRSCDHVIHTLYFKASTLQAKKNKKYILILGVKASTFQAPKKQSPVRVPPPPSKQFTAKVDSTARIVSG